MFEFILTLKKFYDDGPWSEAKCVRASDARIDRYLTYYSSDLSHYSLMKIK